MNVRLQLADHEKRLRALEGSINPPVDDDKPKTVKKKK